MVSGSTGRVDLCSLAREMARHAPDLTIRVLQGDHVVAAFGCAEGEEIELF